MNIRNFGISTILIFILAIISCDDTVDKTDELPYFDFIIYTAGPQKTGEASATVYGKRWEATAKVHRTTIDSQYIELHFTTFSAEGFPRDLIAFGKHIPKVGIYETHKNYFDTNYDDFSVPVVYGQSQDDGDVIKGVYSLDDDTFKQVFIIDAVDSELRLIRGRFELQFLLTEDYYHSGLAKIVRFEDGEFEVSY